MPALSPARLILAVFPALLLAFAAASTLWGDGGWFARFQLEERKSALKEEIVELSAENARLVREISVLQQDPLAVEREVADTIGRAPPGSTLYVFPKAEADGEGPSSQGAP